jgi:8-oxo-dGTP diphosphatase
VKSYVLGYAFELNSQGLPPQVWLIRKNRPEWMSGKWNGLGGKIEPGETAHEAMRREFREEAGVDVERWQPLISLHAGELTQIHVFSTRLNADESRRMASTTDELIARFCVDGLPVLTLPNVRWMVPMAALQYTNPEYIVLGYPTITTGRECPVNKAA